MSSIPTPRRRAAVAPFRAALFASAAVTALFLTCAAPVRADCTGTTEVVCTGDLHDGVHYSGPEKLTVRDLSTEITPPIGQAGISLLNGGARHQTAAIEANVVPYRITTQGQLAPGIAARASGEVTIHSIGTIVTLGPRSEGVTAVSDTGTATVSNEADVFIYGSNANGILARGPAGASVTNSGDVAVHGPNSDAIYARTFIRNGSIWGKASVFNDGHLSTFGVDSRGIFVHSVGDAEVTNSGGIAIGGGQSEGIFVSAYGHAVVHNSGDIAVTGQSSLGIHVFTQGFF